MPGKGESAEEAKTAAVNALGGYVSTQVESTLKTNYEAHQESENGRTAYSKETSDISRNINITVVVKLYALETTDAYYDKSTKPWYVCAFINREKAFEMIRAEADAVREKFVECCKKAEESISSDMFATIRQYNAAQAAGADLLKKTAYASLFNEEAVQKEYGDDTRTVAGISAQVAKLKASTPLHLRVNGDVNNAVFSAVSDLLQRARFALSDRKGCLYNVDATVNTNIEAENIGSNDGKNITLYYSSKGNAVVSITPNGKAAAYIFSTKNKGGKVAAHTKSKVELKVCAALATAIREELPNNFGRFMDGI